MAIYYRWRQTEAVYANNGAPSEISIIFNNTNTFYTNSGGVPPIVNGIYTLPVLRTAQSDQYIITGSLCAGETQNVTECYYCAEGLRYQLSGDNVQISAGATTYPTQYSFTRYWITASAGTFVSYVYSPSSTAYPNGGAQNGYYYDQRTTVTSPTVASNLTYSSSINATLSSSVQLQWTGAQSNTDYPVTEYEISYAINNTDSWQVAGTTGVLTYEFSSIPEEATSIAFRVRAKDSNNQYGDYITGTYSTISREPPITVVTKNIEMNYFNGTDYEILYPVVGSEVYNHVKSGNYVGSGQYGQSNPNRIELEFTPKVALITKTSGVYDTYLLNGKTVSYVQSSTGVSEITVEWTGQTVSWYSADSVEAQLNENGVLYVYTVFG